MKISVVIPAWNAERHIARAIRSVLAQTQPADEIIVINDGSTDGTAEAVRSFGDAVHEITQTNAGASVARNTGLAAAAGDWIAFLDADDEWRPDKLQMQKQLLGRCPHLKWAYANFVDSSRKGLNGVLPALPSTPQSHDGFDDYLDAYCRGYYAWTGTLIVHRSVFDAVGLFEPGMKRAQDNDLWFRIAYRFPQVGYIPQPLAVYHLDTPGSSTKINDQVDFMVALVERHRRLSRQHNRSEAFERCITHMLQVWIRQLAAQNRNADACVLLDRFCRELPPRFCSEIKFRLRMPSGSRRIIDLYLSAKDRLRGRR
jgi:glycosyltransferase involved in cell wall biosynthesis